MRRLLVVLSAFLVLTIFVSSTATAARPSFECRIRSVVNLFRMNAYLFCGSFYLDEGDELLIDGRDFIMGGDADDYAGGRSTGDTPIILIPKTPLRSTGEQGGTEPRSSERGIISTSSID